MKKVTLKKLNLNIEKISDLNASKIAGGTGPRIGPLTLAIGCTQLSCNEPTCGFVKTDFGCLPVSFTSGTPVCC